MATPKNEALQAQTHLIRTIESALKVDVPDATDLKFRGSLLRKASAEIATFSPALVVRLHVAACEVKFPSQEVADFRHVLQTQIAKNLGLSAYKAAKPEPAAR